MYQKVLWTNGLQVIAGAVVNTVTESGRKKVSIQFEDGRWFEGIPEKALSLNVNWTLLNEFVSQTELNGWVEKAEQLPVLLYSVGLEMVVDIEYPKNTRRKVVCVATVSASCVHEAEKAAVQHFEEVGAGVVVRYAKLSGCQITAFNRDIIEAS
jgi:hypothetical protein